jgi:hypothetical protein
MKKKSKWNVLFLDEQETMHEVFLPFLTKEQR